MLIPNGTLGILYDASPSNGLLWDGDGDIRVTGDDLSMAAVDFLRASGVPRLGSDGFSGSVIDSTTDREATAHTRRYNVHVRQTGGLEDFEVEIAMEIDLF